jgi:hypothetical protein
MLSRCMISPSNSQVTVDSRYAGGRTSTPLPGGRVAGPSTEEMKGPIIRRRVTVTCRLKPRDRAAG